MDQHEHNEHPLIAVEEVTTEAEQLHNEPEAIPLGPDTQAIIIQSIN